jgi:hypothetical protein
VCGVTAVVALLGVVREPGKWDVDVVVPRMVVMEVTEAWRRSRSLSRRGPGAVGLLVTVWFRRRSDSDGRVGRGLGSPSGGSVLLRSNAVWFLEAGVGDGS